MMIIMNAMTDHLPLEGITVCLALDTLTSHIMWDTVMAETHMHVSNMHTYAIDSQIHPAGDVLWVFVEPGNVVP